MPKINIPGTKISEINNLEIWRCYKIKQELSTLPEDLSSPHVRTPEVDIHVNVKVDINRRMLTSVKVKR
jgi:hypothetical protein